LAHALYEDATRVFALQFGGIAFMYNTKRLLVKKGQSITVTFMLGGAWSIAGSAARVLYNAVPTLNLPPGNPAFPFKFSRDSRFMISAKWLVVWLLCTWPLGCSTGMD
jgi:hypothetical protein